MTESLYVYYRVRPGAEAEARAAVARLQDALRPRCRETGLQCRSDDLLTWMEIYRDVTDRTGFTAAMQQIAAEVAWGDLLETNRHGQTRVEEWFRAFS